ncbi:MAG: nucleotidyltransferase domain-containing protein [Anaerolineaceae bacterium]|nr:nucleotidyltransferase domain-containing protein [Anaerolineaceae bacterium]
MANMAELTGELREVIRRLVNSLQPEQIYLFGSCARGTQIPGQSDIDLLVILPDSDLPRHQREARSYDSLWGLVTPVDLVVLTREEFNSTSQVKTSLAAMAKNQGVLLYG